MSYIASDGKHQESWMKDSKDDPYRCWKKNTAHSFRFQESKFLESYVGKYYINIYVRSVSLWS